MLLISACDLIVHKEGNVSSITMKKLKKSSDMFREKVGKAALKIMGDDLYVRNQFCAPFSLQTAIGMLLLGSKGITRSQIRNLTFSGFNSSKLVAPHRSLLYLTKEVSKPYKAGTDYDTMNVANRIYIQNGLGVDQKFVYETERCYASDAGDIDFGKSDEARNTINSWAEEKTMGKIEELLPKGSISPNTKLVMVNAIYFYGSWKHQFNASLTKKRDFHIMSNGTKEKTVKVDMMSQWGNFKFCRLDGINAEILKLDYTEERLSMLIILPDKKDGLSEVFTEKFDYKKCFEKNLTRHAKIFIPKFEIKVDYPMKKILSEAGMKDVFVQSKADLSGIAKDGQLFVDEIYHQTFISVNEKGTEAAAATGTVMLTKSRPKTFECDHPFLFRIVENQFGNVLFEGSVSNPRVKPDPCLGTDCMEK